MTDQKIGTWAFVVRGADLRVIPRLPKAAMDEFLDGSRMWHGKGTSRDKAAMDALMQAARQSKCNISTLKVGRGEPMELVALEIDAKEAG